MGHARHVSLRSAAFFVAAVLGGIAAGACASMGNDSSFNGPGATYGGTDAAGSFPNGNVDAGASSTGLGPTTASSGTLVVHAATFPAFRLCFANFPKAAPQPDSAVMPESNVVGVEVGSVVRLDPLTEAPGKVYVIVETALRKYADTTPPPTCADLIPEILQAEDGGTASGDYALTLGNDYFVANNVDQPVGTNRVEVLAITGCGGVVALTHDKIPYGSCGAEWESNQAFGNLEAKVVELPLATTAVPSGTLRATLFQMSSALATFAGKSGTLGVKFGELGADGGVMNGGTAVPVNVAFGSASSEVTLSVDEDASAYFANHGFDVTASSGATSYAIDQSLAETQELSSPRDVPTTYFNATSNYALLLLGDPTYAAQLDGGAANPDYNRRAALHLLAVPIIDPNPADAGSDASPDDAGSL